MKQTDVLPENLRRLEKKVLKISKRHSPSYVRFNKKQFVDRYQKRIFDLFQNRLKYPIRLFKDSLVLDLGSGTGEADIFYSKWGAFLTCVDFNPISIKRHKQLIKKFGLDETRITFYNQSIYDFENPKNIEYDLTISSGVIPHVPDPKLFFKRQVQFLKKGGFTIVSCLNSAGNFQMNLQRYALFKLARLTKKPIEQLAPYIFKEYIDRAEKYGGRLRKSIISDNYVNPKVSSLSSVDVLKLFKENKITFYSSWPPLFPDFIADSTSRKYIDYTKLRNLSFISKSESQWMISSHDDMEKIHQQNTLYFSFDKELRSLCNIVHDVNTTNVESIDQQDLLAKTENLSASITVINDNEQWKKRFTLFIDEINDFIKLINSNERNLIRIQKHVSSYNILFKGNAGIATTSYMGYK